MGLMDIGNKYPEERVSEFDKVFLRQLGSTIRETIKNQKDLIQVLRTITDRPFDGPSDSFYDLVLDMYRQLAESAYSLQQTLARMAAGEAEYCPQAAEVLQEELKGFDWRRKPKFGEKALRSKP